MVRSIFKKVITVLKWILIVWGIIWFTSQLLLYVIPFENIVQFLSDLLGVSNTTFVSDTPTNFSNETLDEIQNQLYAMFQIAGAISAVIGTFVLSQSRSAFEIVWLLAAFVLPRQRKYWGMVFDHQTTKVLPFAAVRLVEVAEDGQDKYVAQTVSDLDGRYRITIPNPTKRYVLDVQLSGYTPWRQGVDPKAIETMGSDVIVDIPMVSLRVSETVTFKLLMQKVRSVLYRPTIVYIYAFSLMAVLMYIYGFLAYMSLVNFFSLATAGVALAWNTYVMIDRFSVNSGMVIDADSKQPVPGAQIRLFQNNEQVSVGNSDIKGGVKFNLKPGVYDAEVIKPGYALATIEGTPTPRFDVRIKANGYLAENIYLHRILDKASDPSYIPGSSLVNPFS